MSKFKNGSACWDKTQCGWKIQINRKYKADFAVKLHTQVSFRYKLDMCVAKIAESNTHCTRVIITIIIILIIIIELS